MKLVRMVASMSVIVMGFMPMIVMVTMFMTVMVTMSMAVMMAVTVTMMMDMHVTMSMMAVSMSMMAVPPSVATDMNVDCFSVFMVFNKFWYVDFEVYTVNERNITVLDLLGNYIYVVDSFINDITYIFLGVNYDTTKNAVFWDVTPRGSVA
jgi:hypothetical protein